MGFISHNFCGPLAQSVEQIPFKDWVASSNLAGLTINYFFMFYYSKCLKCKKSVKISIKDYQNKKKVYCDQCLDETFKKIKSN